MVAHPSEAKSSRAGRTGLVMPIRFKLVGITLVTLVLSFAAYLYFGTTLIETDKTSYVYEFTAAETRATAEQFETQLAAMRRLARVAAALEAAAVPGADAANGRVLEEVSAGLNVDQFALVRAAAGGDFVVVRELDRRADASGSLLTVLRARGWSPRVVREAGLVTAPESEGIIPICSWLADGGTGDLAYCGRMRLDFGGAADAGAAYSLYLRDRAGDAVAGRPASPTTDIGAATDAWRSLAAELPSGEGQRGARAWRVDGREFLLGYRRLTGDLLLVSAIPKNVAFHAVRALMLRSLIIGLGVLLLTAGFATALARAITSRITRLSQATEAVAAGDFAVRVIDRRRARDEITNLADAFGLMAGRIQDLLAETAEKLRMEMELDTGRAYQGELIPRGPMSSGAIRCAGTYLPATECAGDWWRHFALRDQLLLVISDATGHGVRAALTSSLLQGACISWVERYAATGVGAGDEARALGELMRSVNHCALLSGGAGSSTATILALLIDTCTGAGTLANAGHPAAYAVRVGELIDENEPVFKHVRSLGLGKSSLIGDSTEPAVIIEPFQMVAGEAILVFSDGLFDERSTDGRCLRKAEVLETLVACAADGRADALTLNDGLAARVRSFFGVQSTHANVDDVTFVIATLEAP